MRIGFPWTLQRYILREMGKTFALTAIALTGVVGLGWRVREMIRLGEVTPGQLVRLVLWLMPLAVALTLPIAALFSAAATYGRLSADNEFVACRSGGINLHWLLLPPVLLSLVSAVATFALVNFIIPGMARGVDELVRADLGVLVQQRLNSPRGIALGHGRGFAESSEVDAANNRITLYRAAFIEVDEGEWVRYGSAERAVLNIEHHDGGLRAKGWMDGVSLYDRAKGNFSDIARLDLPPNEIPKVVPEEIRFLNLFELLKYGSDPTGWREVREKLERVRLASGRSRTYDRLLRDWQVAQSLILEDDSMRLDIRAKTAGRIPRDGGLELGEAEIELRQGERERTYTAARAVIETTRGDSISECGVRVEAYDVVGRAGESTVRRAKETFGPIAMPPDVVREAAGISNRELLEPADDSAGGDHPVAQARRDAREALASTVRRIEATLHERFAFSFSVLVLVVLGATLGIVFRGAHAIVAFGISFVPSLLVIVTIVMGKQLSQNAATHVIGLIVVWLGIVVVGGLDWWTLMRVLRR